MNTKQKLHDFVDKLDSLGYKVEPVSNRPQIFSIDDKLVNIRCRGKSKMIADGRGFWYSISFDILQKVKWVIYITTTSEYFFMFPSTFLENHKESMYQDNNKAGVGVFDLDWDNEMIILKQGEVIPIREYYQNLVNEDDYPQF
jgi:hypothetical protein